MIHTKLTCFFSLALVVTANWMAGFARGQDPIHLSSITDDGTTPLVSASGGTRVSGVALVTAQVDHGGKVVDNLGATVNLVPQVNAGPDQTVAFPSGAPFMVTLAGGTVIDDHPSITTTWSKVSGPGSVTFTAANAIGTFVNFSEAGVYVLRLTADDGEFQPFDDVSITIIALGGPTAYDLNGDGASDLVWRNMNSSVVAVWLMNGPTIPTIMASEIIGGVPSEWKIEAIGDVSGDGKSDIVWRNISNGVVALWLMYGWNIEFSAFLTGVPLDWVIAGIGDLNGDGKGDIVWRNNITGQVAVWLMNGLTIISSGFFVGMPAAWEIRGVGDIDGDGKGDLVWQNNESEKIALWLMDGLTISSSGIIDVTFASPGQKIKGVGDVNGDSKADLIWQNENSHAVAVWLMNGGMVVLTGNFGPVPVEWELELVGDTNRDGKADLVWRHTSGTVAIWLMNGTAIESVGFPGGVSPEWEMQP